MHDLAGDGGIGAAELAEGDDVGGAAEDRTVGGHRLGGVAVEVEVGGEGGAHDGSFRFAPRTLARTWAGPRNTM